MRRMPGFRRRAAWPHQRDRTRRPRHLLFRGNAPARHRGSRQARQQFRTAAPPPTIDAPRARLRHRLCALALRQRLAWRSSRASDPGILVPTWMRVRRGGTLYNGHCLLRSPPRLHAPCPRCCPGSTPPPMNVFYEEEGSFKVGAIIADNDSSLQVEAPHGKRSKIKSAAVLLRFAEPALGAFMDAAQRVADARSEE